MPPCTPKGTFNLGSFFCAPKRPDLPPPMGAQVPSGHQAPPRTPKGILSPDSLFYFVLVESGTCLPLWGGRRSRVGRGYFSGGSHPRLGCRLGRFAAERHWRSLTPSRCYSLHGMRPCRNGRGNFIFSQGGRGPPWESPFSRGKASLHEGAALRWRASCAGLGCRLGRSWTVPTGPGR